MIETRMESLSQGAQYRCHRYERQSSHKACGREQLGSVAPTFCEVACIASQIEPRATGSGTSAQNIKVSSRALSAQRRASGFLFAHHGGAAIIGERHEAPPF